MRSEDAVKEREINDLRRMAMRGSGGKGDDVEGGEEEAVKGGEDYRLGAESLSQEPFIGD